MKDAKVQAAGTVDFRVGDANWQELIPIFKFDEKFNPFDENGKLLASMDIPTLMKKVREDQESNLYIYISFFPKRCFTD